MKPAAGAPIVVGGKVLRRDGPVFIVAEGCDNHLGSVDVAREMIRQAKLAGADAIKFQHHLPDEEMLPDVPMSANFDEPLYKFLQKHALTLAQHRELKAYCGDVGIHYMCTPFSYRAAEELFSIGVDVFKIGSGEMTDIPSLVRMSQMGLPLIISTGMSTLDEIRGTCDALRAAGTRFALMNCVSEYPPAYEDLNLRVITRLLNEFPEVVIGHSDHSPDLYTSYAAVTLGARIIEKHVILDKRQPGPDQSVSIDMRDLAALVDGIRKVEAALGDVRAVHPREQPIREWALRSVVAVTPIRSGEVIREEMLWTKRPGTGVPAKDLPRFIGRRAVVDIRANTLMRWEFVER